jgi:hypothetical protein
MLQSDDPSRVARRLVQFVREYIALNRDASGKEELEKLGLRLEGE